MPDTPGEELARRLAGYPKDALSFFEKAFAAAASVPEETRRLIFNEVVENLKRGNRRLDGSVLGPLTHLSEREAERLASVYSVVIGLLSESSATPEDFVAHAKGVLFAPAQEDIAKLIATSVCEARPGIRGIVDRAQLAGEVLPSLYSFDIAIDVRVRVVDGKVQTFIPVAVMHIDSDVDDVDLFIQMTSVVSHKYLYIIEERTHDSPVAGSGSWRELVDLRKE
ncbi:MAG TPA: hypothetical protein VKS78_03080, partial [Roseiarcus sp.]|nr:hypothetical protein [Roseiarcus sp.]